MERCGELVHRGRAEASGGVWGAAWVSGEQVPPCAVGEMGESLMRQILLCEMTGGVGSCVRGVVERAPRGTPRLLALCA